VENLTVKAANSVNDSASYALKLQVSDVSFWFDDTCLFTQLSLALTSGDVLVLTGRNGSGKSTLLGILSGLTCPSTGSVHLGQVSRDSRDHSTRHPLYPLSLWCHFIGHRHALKDVLTPEENLRFAYACLQHGNHDQQNRVKAALQAVGLENVAHTLKTHHLSAGQKQRLALARLFMVQRPLWLLDEPTIGLDHSSYTMLRRAIKTHREQGGITIIATHDTPTHFMEGFFTVLNLDDHNRHFPPPAGLFSMDEHAEVTSC